MHEKVTVLKTNDEDGSLRITSYLIELGHRRIGLIQAPDGGSVCLNRTRGYLRALERAKIPVHRDYIVAGGFSVADGQRGIERLLCLASPPTAIVAANDLVAIGAISALKQLGKKVPQDVSVVGFDNIQMSALVDPPLTTISQPTYEMGKRAMEAILERVSDPRSAGKIIYFDTQLIVRSSTAASRERAAPSKTKTRLMK
jgi:DNA-binding LacI/PurR family transcriptional regulator